VLLIAATLVLEVAQMAAGYRHQLAIHIPLGVAIVVANIRLFDRAFGDSAGPRRPIRTEADALSARS
jgi:hypothetical protein